MANTYTTERKQDTVTQVQAGVAVVATLFNTLAKLVIELHLDHSRVFNMDETAFQKQ
ncbi:hypothetical protein PC116_g5615 [Phytophthora cactorum]|nr:hypothetical protein PC116_g5615 [Phytophthora cactorum]